MLGRLTRERTDAGGAEDEAREEGRAEEEEVGTARYESSSDSSSLRRLCAEVKRDKVERCFCRSQGGSSVFCDRKRKKLDKDNKLGRKFSAKETKCQAESINLRSLKGGAQDAPVYLNKLI